MFSAAWCTSCKALKPQIETFVEEHKNEVELVYKDVDNQENMNEASALGVKSLPFVQLRDGDQVLSSFAGVKSQLEIESWYKESI